ncbi:polyunsaturated fatty acid lipoxygenase ALOX15B-like [Amphiura filiformis]|uniref:polyunsaturated fatty acid lipoxygenase ALOX15B-like n=1 Tax=Amphiura filiformis TaxID=82378 RepID=UPI003B21FC3F
MGNFIKKLWSKNKDEPAPQFEIKITTGNYLGQTLNSKGNVCVQLHDKEGQKSDVFKYDSGYFAPGSTQTIEISTEITVVDKVEVWIERTGNKTDLSWFVETIEIKTLDKDQPDAANTSSTQVFPFHRWITMRRQLVKLWDAILPQLDTSPQRRKEGILLDKKWYSFSHNAADCIPVKTDLESSSEWFSRSYFSNVFKKQGLMNTIKEKLLPFVTKSWKTLGDIANIYAHDFLHFDKPKIVDDQMNALKNKADKDWIKLDKMFGKQRLTGTNPIVIRRVESYEALKESIDVRYIEDNLSTKVYLNGFQFEETIDAKRLYMVDYTDILSDVECRNGLIAAPIALFFVNNDDNLMPIAIQLFKPHFRSKVPIDGGSLEESPLTKIETDTDIDDNPVFLPSDPNLTWFLAKMWFNNADASYHQSNSHLAFTHLVMETMYLALRQTVSLSHPIFRLMAPHFLYMLNINKVARDLLLNEGGWVDTKMTIGVKGMLEIIRRRYQGTDTVKPWRLDVDGFLKEDIKNRGVEDLPKYTFRDDALELHNIIKKYVEDIVEHHYTNDASLAGDYEIQAWAEKLHKKVDEGGCGLQGVPCLDDSSKGHFSSNDDLVKTVTSVIYTCSVAHAAVNFLQYEEYGFPLNYPALLHGDPPRDKDERKEDDILQALPTMPETLGTMNVADILSKRATQKLGDFEVNYQFDGAGKRAVKRFQDALEILEKQIEDRPDKSYDVLNPDKIPNAISI